MRKLALSPEQFITFLMHCRWTEVQGLLSVRSFLCVAAAGQLTMCVAATCLPSWHICCILSIITFILKPAGCSTLRFYPTTQITRLSCLSWRNMQSPDTNNCFLLSQRRQIDIGPHIPLFLSYNIHMRAAISDSPLSCITCLILFDHWLK